MLNREILYSTHGPLNKVESRRYYRKLYQGPTKTTLRKPGGTV